MINLDFLCMRTAQQMVDCEGAPNDKENLANKSLGVLLENGPYGLTLYLETHDDKERIARHYQQKLVGLCREELLASYLAAPVPQNSNFEQITEWLRTLAQDLDRYLFMKRLWEQALTYARYHARALKTQTGTQQALGRGVNP